MAHGHSRNYTTLTDATVPIALDEYGTFPDFCLDELPDALGSPVRNDGGYDMRRIVHGKNKVRPLAGRRTLPGHCNPLERQSNRHSWAAHCPVAFKKCHVPSDAVADLLGSGSVQAIHRLDK